MGRGETLCQCIQLEGDGGCSFPEGEELKDVEAEMPGHSPYRAEGQEKGGATFPAAC